MPIILMPQTRRDVRGIFSSSKGQRWVYNYKNIQDNMMTFYPPKISVYLNHDLFQQHWLATKKFNENKFRNVFLEFGVWIKF